jgi:hypothetical protein
MPSDSRKGPASAGEGDQAKPGGGALLTPKTPSTAPAKAGQELNLTYSPPQPPHDPKPRPPPSPQGRHPRLGGPGRPRHGANRRRARLHPRSRQRRAEAALGDAVDPLRLRRANPLAGLADARLPPHRRRRRFPPPRRSTIIASSRSPPASARTNGIITASATAEAPPRRPAGPEPCRRAGRPDSRSASSPAPTSPSASSTPTPMPPPAATSTCSSTSATISTNMSAANIPPRTRHWAAG